MLMGYLMRNDMEILSALSLYMHACCIVYDNCIHVHVTAGSFLN